MVAVLTVEIAVWDNRNNQSHMALFSTQIAGKLPYWVASAPVWDNKKILSSTYVG